jgi:hypothetical protein
MTGLLSGIIRLCLVALALAAGPAPAAELVYIHETGCPYCRLWESRIEPIYLKSAENRRAPLRRVHKDSPEHKSLNLAKPVRYTPTFILMEDGAEIGRIEGYPGEDFFWGLLEPLVLRLR